MQEEKTGISPSRLNLQQAKYGCFLVLPLKFDAETVRIQQLEADFQEQPMTTMDLNENIKAMLNGAGEASVGVCRFIPKDSLAEGLCGAAGADALRACTVSSEDGTYSFYLQPSYLYLFHTQVAFLCLGLSFDRMEALHAICNPGSAENHSAFHWLDGSGRQHPFDMQQWLEAFCGKFGLHKFFDGKASPVLEAYTYTLALVPERFDTLEEMRKITFNLHQMMPLDTPIEDDSEADIRYVYAVKNQLLASYRWGCCVSSQTISYVVADETMDLDAEMRTQACDGLPVVMLALYEKYTCLRFTELISRLNKKQMKGLQKLKRLMLEFQAFGTVTPANLSRWHNVKQIYASLLEVNDIPTAVHDISTKIDILAEHQHEIESARNETVINIITLFGIVSILASVLSIIQILSGGDPWTWLITILTTLFLVVAIGIAVRLRR